MESKDKKGIYTGQFWLLCTSSLLFFGSFNMLLPELPNFLTKLGGADYKGWIIAIFTVTAGLSRPFSGKLTDKVGRIPVMMFGVAVCVLCGFLYPLVGSVFGFLLLRFVHGLSTGFKPTATSAYVADIIPAERRGEALGLLGMAGTTGMALSPLFGSAITNAFGLEALFYSSSIIAAISVLILFGMKETLPNPEKFKASHLRISPGDVIEPKTLPAAVAVLLTMFSFGIMLTLIPDFSEHLGFDNKGIYLTVFTIASVCCRFFAGKASDKYGRVNVMLITLWITVIGLLVTGFATTQTTFLAGAVIFGIGSGSTTPALYAWTIDISDPNKRGKAIATMYIALELGIGGGALVSAALYDNNPERLNLAFSTGALLCALTFFYLLAFRKRSTDKALAS
ncbi:MFS transporter [Fulvitalea axinellae]|uniref:MFS transporter n=1 Tax=Fulvitalea axinellae TaxID=1182444 RepID=A0AAU9CKL5_9BACT|nr:MFS transporter [Fulvitalea axinellae]